MIGGYTPPEGSRKYFGALLVGYYGPDGLLFAGRVGTGFSERVLAELYGAMQRIKRATCPFVNLPEKRLGRWGPGDHAGSHETLSLGRTGAGRPGQVYRVDQRRPTSSTRLPGIANRQETAGGRSGIGTRSHASAPGTMSRGRTNPLPATPMDKWSLFSDRLGSLLPSVHGLLAVLSELLTFNLKVDTKRIELPQLKILNLSSASTTDTGFFSREETLLFPAQRYIAKPFVKIMDILKTRIDEAVSAS